MLSPKPAAGILLLTLGLASASPAGPRLEACVDFGCQSREAVVLPDEAWALVEQQFTGSRTPAEERAAIGRAVALLEDRVGRITGTWRDRAENWQRAGEPGELDCIAESRNTAQYIAAFEQAGLLRWHLARPRARRNLFIFAHWTAVIEDRSDGSRWAVDSWFRDNGQPPVIMRLQDWYQRKEPAT